jgi:hypothetical protein
LCYHSGKPSSNHGFNSKSALKSEIPADDTVTGNMLRLSASIVRPGSPIDCNDYVVVKYEKVLSKLRQAGTQTTVVNKNNSITAWANVTYYYILIACYYFAGVFKWQYMKSLERLVPERLQK